MKFLRKKKFTQRDVQLIKTDKAQYIEFDKKRISWVKLMNFEKANERQNSQH